MNALCRRAVLSSLNPLLEDYQKEKILVLRIRPIPFPEECLRRAGGNLRLPNSDFGW